MEIKKPMLAVAIEEISEIRYPIFCTQKIDGIRALLPREDGELVTRNFKLFPNNYVREMAEVLPKGLDGEMIVEGNFNEVSSALMSRDGEPKFTYMVFDYVVDLEEPYVERVKRLKGLKLPKWVKKVIPIKVNNEKELLEFEKKCLGKGYEGVIFRVGDSPYKFGRSSPRQQWLCKLKRFQDAEAEVLELIEQLENTNTAKKDVFGHTERSHEKAGMVPKNTLGALRVRDIVSGIEFKIGTGMDDALRQEIWNNPKKYVGKLVKYKSQKCGEKTAPRFPVFLGFRSKADMGD